MNFNTPHLKYGGIAGIVIGLISLILNAAKIQLPAEVQMAITVGVLFVGVFMAVKMFVAVNGNGSFKNVFVAGFRTTTVICLMVIIFGVLTILCFPKLKTATLDYWEKEQKALVITDSIALSKQIQSKNYPADTAIKLAAETRTRIKTDKAMYSDKFMTLFIGQNLMPTMALGLVASLMATLFYRRKNI